MLKTLDTVQLRTLEMSELGYPVWARADKSTCASGRSDLGIMVDQEALDLFQRCSHLSASFWASSLLLLHPALGSMMEPEPQQGEGRWLESLIPNHRKTHSVSCLTSRL